MKEGAGDRGCYAECQPGQQSSGWDLGQLQNLHIGVERWLSCRGHLLLQGSEVWFPAPASHGAQSPVIATLGNMLSLLASEGLAHSCACTQRHTHQSMPYIELLLFIFSLHFCLHSQNAEGLNISRI